MLIYEPNMFFLEFFTSPPMEEPWAKVTKPFTTMPIYKASILFLNGQVILITSSIRNTSPSMTRRILVFHNKEKQFLLSQGNPNQNKLRI